MIIYDRLKKDPDLVKEMMTRIEEMSSRASTSKVKLFEEMKGSLTAHLRAEEKVFYDAMKREKSAHDSTLEGYEEHHVADLLMREISRLSPSDEKWKAKFTVLKECVEHHIDEEGRRNRAGQGNFRRCQGAGARRCLYRRKRETDGQNRVNEGRTGRYVLHVYEFGNMTISDLHRPGISQSPQSGSPPSWVILLSASLLAIGMMWRASASTAPRDHPGPIPVGSIPRHGKMGAVGPQPHPPKSLGPDGRTYCCGSINASPVTGYC